MKRWFVELKRLAGVNVDRDWIEAFAAVDRKGDQKPLLALLRSDQPVTPDARWYLADLIDRHRLVRRRGRPRTPAYDPTFQQARLEQAEREWRQGYRSKEAIARAYDIPLETLEAHFAGRRAA